MLRLASSAFSVLESELLLALLESVAVGPVLSAASSDDEELALGLPPSRLSSGSVELVALVLGSVLLVAAAVRTLLSAAGVVLV